MKYKKVTQQSSHGGSVLTLDEDDTKTEALSSIPVPSIDSNNTLCAEASDLLLLAVPIAISRLAWVGMKTTDTALIGHTGTRYLSSSALSDLWMQSTGVFLSGGVLSIFAAQAVGSVENKKMAGIWAQVSLFVLALISLPVIASYLCTGLVLAVMKTDRNLLESASYYAFILTSAIPARILSSQISQYFMAQRITTPLVVCGLMALFLNLVFGFIFVLGVPTWPGFGFRACPIVTSIVEWFQILFMIYWYCYRLQLHADCWPGWSTTHITLSRVKEFSYLYFPAALSGASDWWRVSAIGAVAVSFGDEASLAVFNSSYRIMWICLIFVGSIGSALSVKLSNALGAGNAAAGKQVVIVAILLAVTVLTLFATLVYAIPDKLAYLFTSDPVVIRLYEKVALPLACALLFMNLSVLLEKIPLSCGRSKLVFWLGVVGSWGGQVPGVLLATRFWRNDINGLFWGVAFGYALLDVILLFTVFTTDYQKYADLAVERSRLDCKAGGEVGGHDIELVDGSDMPERGSERGPEGGPSEAGDRSQGEEGELDDVSGFGSRSKRPQGGAGDKMLVKKSEQTNFDPEQELTECVLDL